MLRDLTITLDKPVVLRVIEQMARVNHLNRRIGCLPIKRVLALIIDWPVKKSAPKAMWSVVLLGLVLLNYCFCNSIS